MIHFKNWIFLSITALFILPIISAQAHENGNAARLVVTVANFTHMAMPLSAAPMIRGAVQIMGPAPRTILYPGNTVDFYFLASPNSSSYDVAMKYAVPDMNSQASGCLFTAHCGVKTLGDQQQYCEILTATGSPLQSPIEPHCHVTLDIPAPPQLTGNVLVQLDEDDQKIVRHKA